MNVWLMASDAGATVTSLTRSDWGLAPDGIAWTPRPPRNSRKQLVMLCSFFSGALACDQPRLVDVGWERRFLFCPSPWLREAAIRL